MVNFLMNLYMADRPHHDTAPCSLGRYEHIDPGEVCMGGGICDPIVHYLGKRAE